MFNTYKTNTGGHAVGELHRVRRRAVRGRHLPRQRQRYGAPGFDDLMCMSTCVCICVCIDGYVHVYMCVCVCIDGYVRVFVCAWMYVRLDNGNGTRRDRLD